MDDGHAVAYQALEPGTPVRTSDGVQIGTVREVLENEREHIFDGLVIETPDGRRFVDAPEVGRIAERGVTLTIDAQQARALPAQDSAGGPSFEATGRARRFGRLWRPR